MNRKPFEVGEWYHCYTRGVDKRRTFQSRSDYQRFQELMYLANSDKTFRRTDIKARHADIFTLTRGQPIVSIAAYCLMSNHFHIVMGEVIEGGISRFMQKLGTGYSMYFNAKNERIGNLFVRPFRSRHIADDRYLKHAVNYVHLNPLDVVEPKWKQHPITGTAVLEEKLIAYPYSSLSVYCGRKPCELASLDTEAISLAASEQPFHDTLEDARAYYAELESRGVTS